MPSLNSSALLGLSILLLTACTKVYSNNCGILFTYEPAYQQKVAKQLAELKEDPRYTETVTMVMDYGTTRNSIRECLKER